MMINCVLIQNNSFKCDDDADDDDDDDERGTGIDHTGVRSQTGVLVASATPPSYQR